MLKIKLLPIAALIGLGFLSTAQADSQAQDDRWYVAPSASYVHSGGASKASDGWGGTGSFGKIIDEHFNVEVRGFYQGYTAASGHGDVTTKGGTIDLQYYFSRGTFSPYGVVAVGGMEVCSPTNTGGCRAAALGEAGLGFAYEINDQVSFRSDVRYRGNVQSGFQTNPNNPFNDMVVNAGFVIPFGDKPKTNAVKFDVPAPAPVVQTPRPAPAPLPIPQSKLILKGEHFKFDSAELTPHAKTILDEVSASLIAYPEKHEVLVQGHASSEGSVPHNLKLSERRAQSVVSYLKHKGVTNKLSAKGFGSAKPVADNRTEEGRSENRRVELIWIEN